MLTDNLNSEVTRRKDYSLKKAANVPGFQSWRVPENITDSSENSSEDCLDN
jgi:hypothetical protein